MPTLNKEIYSPRWGHNDTYEFDFQNNVLTIKMNMRITTYTDDPGHDPIRGGSSTLDQTFTNDSIQAPHGTEDALIYLWQRWREGELNDVQLDEELGLFVEFINATTRSKPTSKFWRGYF